MKTLLLTFGIFIIVILGMAVGYIFSKRTIKRQLRRHFLSRHEENV